MNDIQKINLQIILLSYVLNPGAIIFGLALFSIMLPSSGVFNFISTHQYTNYIAIAIGAVLMGINFFYVSKLGKQKVSLQNTYNKAHH